MTTQKPKGASDDRADKGVAFMASVIMLNTVLAARNDETCENSDADNIPAFAGQVKANLWKLYQQLGVYFDADPMETEEENEVPFTKSA